MADSAFRTQISADENANALDNPIFAQLSDGTNALSVTGGVLDVNATVTLETAFDDNSAWTFNTDKVNAQGFVVDEAAVNSVSENNIGLARMTPERIVLQIIADDVDNTRRLTINSDGTIGIGDGTDQLEINADGSINVVVAGSSGTKVNDFKTATPGAAASDNHDYTVVGTTFELSRVDFSGSGKLKVEIQTGPLASLVTAAVRFIEKDAGSYVKFDPVIVVPVTSTGTVRVVVTNRQGAAVDVYSTIMGVDIA